MLGSGGAARGAILAGIGQTPQTHCTLHPDPYTLHLTPCNLHPAPYTLTHTQYNMQNTQGEGFSRVWGSGGRGQGAGSKVHTPPSGVEGQSEALSWQASVSPLRTRFSVSVYA